MPTRKEDPSLAEWVKDTMLDGAGAILDVASGAATMGVDAASSVASYSYKASSGALEVVSSTAKDVPLPSVPLPVVPEAMAAYVPDVFSTPDDIAKAPKPAAYEEDLPAQLGVRRH